MTPNVGILDYGAGNVFSVATALEKQGASVRLVKRPEDARHVSHLVFPGVGHASAAMQMLAKSNLDALLVQTAKPVLAICLGHQLLFEFSEEGNTGGLGVLKGTIKKFVSGLTPHMGWAPINSTGHPWLQHVNSQLLYAYFVHSYYAEPGATTALTSDQPQLFSAGEVYKNYFTFQFHPEKSGPLGTMLLSKFIAL